MLFMQNLQQQQQTLNSLQPLNAMLPVVTRIEGLTRKAWTASGPQMVCSATYHNGFAYACHVSGTAF